MDDIGSTHTTLRQVILRLWYAAAHTAPRSLSKLAYEFEVANPRRYDFQLFRVTAASGMPFASSYSGSVFNNLVRRATEQLNTEVNRQRRDDLLRAIGGLDAKHLDMLSPETCRGLHESLQGLDVEPEASDDLLLNGLLLPALRFETMRRCYDVNDEGVSSFVVTLTEMDKLVSQIESGLSDAVGTFGYPGKPLPIRLSDGKIMLATREHNQRLPWKTLDTACKVVTAIHSCLTAALDPRFTLPSNEPAPLDPTVIGRLIGRLRDLAQLCWMSAKQLSSSSGWPEDPECKSEWGQRELQMLNSLICFERLARNNVRAAVYAVYALAKDRRLPSGYKLQPKDQENLYLFATCSGFWTLDLPTLPADRTAHKEPKRTGKDFWQPAVVQSLSNGTLRSAIDTVNSHALKWRGFGRQAVEKVTTVNDDFKPDVYKALFEAMVYVGDFSSAVEVYWRAKNVGRLWPASVGEVLAFADAIVSVSQKALLPHRDLGGSLKNVLRRLWKQVKVGDVTELQSLFVHHVLTGVVYLAVDNHAVGGLVRALRYRTVNPELLFSEYEEFVNRQLRFGFGYHVIRSTAFQGELSFINDTDVLISLTLTEGHMVRIVALGPNGDPSTLEVSSTDHPDGRNSDWHRLLAAFHKDVSEDLIIAAVTERSPCFSVPESVWDDIVKLVLSVVKQALKVNPRAQTILLHSQLLWDCIPWQYMVTSVLKQEVGFELSKHAGWRPWRKQQNDTLIICRVPGVRAQDRTEMRDSSLMTTAEGAPVPVVFDEDDKTCQQIAERVQNNGDVPRAGIQTFIYHGRNGGIFKKLVDDNGNDGLTQLLKRYDGSPVVILHMCYAAHVGNRHNEDELGALPGLFMNHGARVVIASAHPVTVAQAVRTHQYFLAIHDLKPESILDKYRVASTSASQDDRHVALYTLFIAECAPQLPPSTRRAKVSSPVLSIQPPTRRGISARLRMAQSTRRDHRT